MSTYANTLRSMQEAILDNAPQALFPLLTPSDTLPARINVYVEGYRTRLRAAILSDYPALAHCLGTDSMNAYVAGYIEATPPTSYTLDAYPIPFASYLERVCDDRFACDLALLESAIAEVFWLPDSAPFTPPAGITPEALMELQLSPRTASRLLVLDYPAEAYVQAFRAENAIAIPDAKAAYLLVLRHDNAVKRHTLSHTEYLIVKVIMEGNSVGKALEHIANAHPALLPEMASQLEGWFAAWVAGGFFTARATASSAPRRTSGPQN